jgi:hypothetical protein
MDLSTSTPQPTATHCCPLCGSDQFGVHTSASGEDFVTQTCAECGLICRVVIGPGSPSLTTLGQEWAAAFAHD